MLLRDLLRYAGVSFVGFSVFVVTYVVAGTPSRVASRLGMRGLRRQRALRDNQSWAQVEPLVRWLGVRVGGALSDEQYLSLDRKLSLAGDFLGLTPEEYVALSLLSMMGGVIVGLLFGTVTGIGPLLAVIVGPVGAMLPYLAVSDAAEKRIRQINRGLPYVIDLMALAMSAGQDFPGAVRQVVEKSSDPNDALVEEFALILQELSLGITRKQALEGFARRAPSESVAEFVGAVVQAEDRGNPVASVLQVQASVSRVRRTVRAEENAAKAGVAMVGPLLLLFLCIMLLVMAPMLLKIQKDIQ
jgi:tight adherence protein C